MYRKFEVKQRRPVEFPAFGRTAVRPEAEAIKRTLAAGVTAVSAHQLFPTPAPLARRMVALAQLPPEAVVLEPSAGTGNICQAIVDEGCRVYAVEINGRLSEALARRFAEPADKVRGLCRNVLQGDFLEIGPDQLGYFDRIIMNPPFEKGDDIKHILHARRFLAPRGRIVALCANGPRQQAALKPLARLWEDLPRDTFAGTSVSAALMVIE